MARYTGPVCRQCRREGEKLFLKGERCFTGKCAMEKRAQAPGQHGGSRRKQSEYGLQLRAKQKTRRIYGVLESQFHRYYEKSIREKGVKGENMLIHLERRLDNVAYRLGFGKSRAQVRQLVNHGHFQVNGKKVDIPSYEIKEGDIITVRDKSRSVDIFKDIRESGSARPVPKWLDLNAENLTGKVIALPMREDIEASIEEHLIVEFYSR